MKFISLVVVALVVSFFSTKKLPPHLQKTYDTLVVFVKNASNQQGIEQAEVSFLKEGKLILQQKTASDGTLKISLPADNYEVQTRAMGFETQKLLGFHFSKNFKNQLIISLQPAILDEVVVKFYQKNNPENTRESDVRMRELSAATAETTDDATLYFEEKVAGSSPTSKAKPDARPATTRKMLTKSTSPTSPAESIESSPEPMSGANPRPRAGLLTAGEWNDLNNWQKHWVDLLTDGEIDSHQKTYGFFPKHRFTVFLENENHFPAIDARVRLLAGNQILWEARTDNFGKAELWLSMFDKNGKMPQSLQLEAEFEGKKIALGTPQSTSRHTLKFECQSPKNVDIVWAVDATGSMGDELEFLKTELLDVIEKVKDLNPDLAFRMGTVFYRDRDDDYLTKSSALNFDIAKTVEFIKKQYAAGGGDYPEAVDAALEEVVQRQNWSADAVARICFLVLDASPHQTPESNAKLQKNIALAAQKGIRIVPVAASGIQKDTEFLMKFFGLATNGTYVFLTDHSGIGGKHLEPTTDEFKVEAFNQLLIRLITEFTILKKCDGKSVVRFDDPQQPTTWEVAYFPNPASNQFSLELPTAVQSVVLYNSEGKSVRKLENLQTGTTNISVSDLPEGIYTLRILKDNEWRSGKIVVARS